MPTSAQVMACALSQVGYSRWDDPETGTKYGRAYAAKHGSYYGASGVPFCAMFVTWVFNQLGSTPPGGDVAYVPYFEQRNPSIRVNKYDAKYGDIITFDWDGDGVADHIGFVENNPGGYVQTVEGNTDNGRVARKNRNWSTVHGVYRPAYSSSAPASKPAASASTSTPKYTGTDHQLMLDVDGVPGGKTYARFNQVMGTGVGGAPTAAMWKKFQQFLNSAVADSHMRVLTGAPNLAVDGVVGEKTWKAYQFWVANIQPHFMHVSGGPSKLTSATWNQWIDGEAGVKTWRSLQHCLNSSFANSGKLCSK